MIECIKNRKEYFVTSGEGNIMQGNRFILLAVVVVGMMAADASSTELAVWAGEGSTYGQVESWVDMLAEEGVSIYLNISPGDLEDPDLLSLIRYCNLEDVEVRGWLVVDYELGYWPNERNAEEVLAFAGDFLDWVDGHALSVEWLSIDMEIPIYQMQRLTELIEKGDYLRALYILMRNVDREKFERAVSTYRDLVDMAHERGVSVHCVTLPMVLDDFQDGDDTLQDAMEIPVLPIPWDEVSVMVYRSHYTEMFGFDMGAGLVHQYALDARYLWGDRGCIDIGVVEDVAYDRPAFAARDASGIKAAGVDRIHYYSLENIMKEEGVEWFRAVRDAEPDVPWLRPSVWVMRAGIQMVDWLICD